MRKTLLVALAILIGCSRDDGTASGTGTVEITETDVAPAAAARVLRVVATEGQSVRPGDTLVLLTQASLGADIEQRRARVSAAEAELRDLLAGARPAEIEQAEAQLRSAEAEAERTRREAERFATLLASGAASEQQNEAAQTEARVAASRRDTAREALRLVREGARPEQIRAARAAVANARAQVQMAEATLADLVLTSPVEGIVLARYVEPGEVLAAGTPAMSLGDPTRPWIRVFVSPAVVARLRVGHPATVRLDGAPDRSWPGHVTAIASIAEFTPRVALTEKERADLLFGVRVQIDDSTGTVKAGLPATVTFPPVTDVDTISSRQRP
jgi:HlyD family secretion protein